MNRAGSDPGSSANADPANSGGFTSLFNGSSTAGWVNPYDWGHAVATNGELRLTSDQKFFLVYEKPYKNFILQADVLIPPGGKGGLEFRSQFGHNFTWGYQAAVDSRDRDWAGGLWVEGIGWLAHPRHGAPVEPGRWNHYTVEANGDHIQIWVNGYLTVDVHDSTVSGGYIALQDHGTKGGSYYFKNILIKDLGG